MGRPTIFNAVSSAWANDMAVNVVIDGMTEENEPVVSRLIRRMGNGLTVFVLPQRYGQYGSMAANVGAIMSPTPWVTYLDDDDELGAMYRHTLEECILQNLGADIWIPGLVYNDGTTACMEPGLKPGNVAIPTYRKGTILRHPFYHNSTADERFIDYAHIYECTTRIGARVGWMGKPVYFVRPHLEGRNGVGS